MDFEKEADRVLDALPAEPPEGSVDIMLNRGFLKTNMLIYSADWLRIPGEPAQRAVRVHCTACGQEELVQRRTFYAGGCSQSYGYNTDPFGFVHPETDETIKSWTTCACPMCGGAVTAIHVGRVSNDYAIEHETGYQLANIEGHLALIEWHFSKWCNKSGLVTYRVRGGEAAAMIGKRMVRYTGHAKYFYSDYYHEWERRKRFDDMFDEVALMRMLPYDRQIINGTEAEKSAMEVYLNPLQRYGKTVCYPLKYLKIWKRYPQIENLIRSGHKGLVDCLISDARGWANYGRSRTFDIRDLDMLDLKKKRPHEILGVQKEELQKVAGMNADQFSLFKYLRGRRIREVDEVMKLVDPFSVNTAQRFFEESPQLPVVKTMRYLSAQRQAAGKQADLIGFRYLKDYWNMVKNVQGEIPAALMWPKQLIREHDRMLTRVKEKEDQELCRQIVDRLSNLEPWCFTDEELGLCIRPAASHAELITEGKVLNHCVATYAQSHASGKTTILFIRSTADPDIPFYTLEYKDGKVMQNRGKKNCAKTPEVELFEKRWLQHMRGVKQNAG